jgi:diguanylate cyclase (GGDEF)-like protein
MLAEARAGLDGGLRPLNLEYTEQVEELRRHERDLIQVAQRQVMDATQTAIILHLGLGAALLVLASLIAWKTRSLIAAHTQTIFDQMHRLEQAGSHLEHQATHDVLTGLANRALFNRRLEEALVHAAEEGFSIAVMYIDLDDFKQVNDVHGHAMGDVLLRAVAQRLQRVVRMSDTAARLGGDEFALLYVGVQYTDNCADLCAKVELEVCQSLEVESLHLTPACSIGYAIYPRDGDSLDRLLKAADTRMYEVKRERKATRVG